MRAALTPAASVGFRGLDAEGQGGLGGAASSRKQHFGGARAAIVNHGRSSNWQQMGSTGPPSPCRNTALTVPWVAGKSRPTMAVSILALLTIAIAYGCGGGRALPHQNLR